VKTIPILEPSIEGNVEVAANSGVAVVFLHKFHGTLESIKATELNLQSLD